MEETAICAYCGNIYVLKELKRCPIEVDDYPHYCHWNIGFDVI